MMFIKDDIIQLRAAEPTDAQTIYGWENDMSVWHVSDCVQPLSLFKIEQFLFSNDDIYAQRQLRLMIDLADENKSVGCIDIFDFDPHNSRCSVGILVTNEYREKHIASRAVKLVAEYVFGTLMLKQIYCVVDEKNTASIALFKNNGFEQCGFRKCWIRTSDGYIGQIEFQLINNNC